MDRFTDEFLDLEVIRAMLPELITEAMRNTVVFTLIGFTGGLGLGLVLALMRLSRRRWLRWPSAIFVDTFRGLPALLVIVFIGFGLPIAVGVSFPFPRYTPGCLALALVSGAYLAETVRSGVEAVPRGQVEAARSLGMGGVTVMTAVVLPQAFRIIIPPLTNELVLLFKDTALLAVLGTDRGGKEITKFAKDFVNSTANTSPLIAAGVAYLVITIPLIRLVSRMEMRNRPTR